tara:strand:+ start:364 stop:996 length:633 start_codon:yes stop_codon:yes gene_type:complete
MKKLIFFLSHLDDFELSCYGFLIKNFEEYEEITIVIASHWEPKVKIWQENLKLFEKKIKRKINYINLGYGQRTLTTNFDELKDKFYNIIDFKSSRFDIITHDDNDCHTDHVSVHNIAKGIYKYAQKFLTVYSPSSINFSPNYWIGLDEQQFKHKKQMLDKYDINVEQSYTKLGYYLQSDTHYDIGSCYFHENFVNVDYSNYECYKILKWI